MTDRSQLQRMQRLRAASASLETPTTVRADHVRAAAEHAQHFLASLPERAAYAAGPAKADTLAAMQLRDQGGNIEDALAVIAQHVDGIGHNLGSSRFFGYIPSGALHEAAIADYLAAVSNRYAGVGKAAPGATRMDEVLLRWLASVIGYPEGSEGDLTSGGSMAALSAVITAREAHNIRSRDVEQAVVYLTPQTHHTFSKALHIAGLGDCVVRTLAVDVGQRMQTQALSKQIEADRQAGLHPWFVCASAGTTDVGAVDPLPQIAEIAATEELWFHIDGAYGGAFALCEPGKRRLAGIERSDSILLEPHKGIFLPCGTGILLVRDGKKLYNA